MKTKSLILASVMATAISAPTMAADWFVGGGVGAQQNSYKGSSQANVDPGFNAEYFKETENNVIYEARAGVYLNDSNRIYGTYSYNSDDFSRQQSFLMSYDYLVGLGDSNKLNWFIGATAGVNHISPDTSAVSSDNRFVWGGQTGLMYKINDQLSAEVGYRYLKQDYDVSVTNPVPTPMNIGSTESASLNDSQQLYMAVDYRF
ncbi:PhoP/Q and low Mg2+ inducible outer membrane protein H1 [Shewanella sairae]|uniref:PhoP/Q and low Mg2+ inducible outer membrane protein H1 n=1 Tax=Shewanella sairae TaxID=190310 RepID=A0ABQ4NZ84_9GAMM|nr:outer membrane beta-barrel protein [Shewanella sairae]MCL1129140.1 porin family protein [Shewanella sairae]GIU40373.1 PhoP/Q and low Mg2+ inducible outer membrane protein H1 [Shewanella sairae]